MRAIIFDIDGTLLRSSEVDDRIYRQAVQTILGRVRFRGSLHEYEHVSDIGILTQVFSDNGIEADAPTVDAIKSEFFRGVREYVDKHGPFPEIPGAGNFLARIEQSPDHVFAIATGGWRESARIKLQAAGIPYERAPLASSDDAADRADIMMHALRSLGKDVALVTYFGDGPWDRAASDRLGWSFVGVGAAIGGIDSFHDQPLDIASE